MNSSLRFIWTNSAILSESLLILASDDANMHLRTLSSVFWVSSIFYEVPVFKMFSELKIEHLVIYIGILNSSSRIFVTFFLSKLTILPISKRFS